VISSTTPATCGAVSNTASVVVANQAGTIPTATASATVNCPNLKVTKTTDTGTISAGDPAHYAIKVENTGTGTAKGVKLDDVVPAGITWTEDSPYCSITAGNLHCDFPDMPQNASYTVNLNGTTPNGQCVNQTNTATVSATNERASDLTDNTSTANISVNCAQVSVLKTADASPVSAGDTIGFTITTTNNGAGTAHGVTVTDVLPPTAGTSWTITTANSGCTLNAGTLSCVYGDLATGASKTVHISSPTTSASCSTLNNQAGVTTTNDGSPTSSAQIVVLCPDVSVQKTLPDGQAATVSAGDNISFKIVTTVGGPAGAVAKSVSLSDILPANTSGWSVQNDAAAPTACNIVAGVVVCNFGDVTAPKTFTITISGKAIGATGGVTCGDVTNTATVSASNEPASNKETGNSSSATIKVNCPSVSITKTASNSPINAGEKAEFVITVKNAGPGKATGVVVSDALPSPTLAWAVDPAVNGCAILAGVLTCTGGDFASMDANATIVIKVSATTNPAVCGTLVNLKASASASNDPQSPHETGPVTIVVNCPDLSITKVATPSTINAGDTASYTLTVKNHGQGTAKNVTLTDNVPQNGINWSEDSTFCSIANNVLSCTFADLAPNATASVTLSGTSSAAQCGQIPNSASTAADNESNSEVAQADNKSSDTITVNCPDIKLEKTPDDGQVNAGDQLSFTIKVTNLGPGVARDVEINDTLPAGPTNWSVDDTDNCDITAGKLHCAFDGDVAKDASRSVVLTAETSAEICGAIDNEGFSSASNEAEKDQLNNSDTGKVTVNCPDVDVVKTADGSPINPGENAAFTITISNAGPGKAYDIELKDVLPAGITWSADNPDNCDITSGTLECGFKSLDANDTLVIHVSGEVSVDQCGTLTNTADITVGNEPESAAEDNTSTASVVVACGSIQIVKVDHVSANNPQSPADDDWDFSVTGANSYSRSIALGGGSVTITHVPLGSYSVAEAEARFGECPRPTDGDYRTVASNPGEQTLAKAGDVITFTFTNSECGVVLSTGGLEIHKVQDNNGNHQQDPGEIGLVWTFHVVGPEFPGGADFQTDGNGNLLLPGIKTGTYTVTEASKAGYATVGVVTVDESPVFTASGSTSVSIAFEDTDVVTFYNQPRGQIRVHKVAINRHNGVPTESLGDEDGWTITLTSATCGVSQQGVTDANGNVSFSNLPICSDYVVAENPNNPASPGFLPAGPVSVTGITPGLTQPLVITFTNEKATNDPPCPNCNTAQTPTPVPTSTPVPSTSTPVPPINTQVTSASPTASPSTTAVAGEKTPGPGGPTPIAPSTGAGLLDKQVGGMNFMLVLLGLLAVSGGLLFVAVGRKSR
jgi:uncharacterized repeat protein (TIGR01451 family)